MRYARGCWGLFLGSLCEIVVRPAAAGQRWRCLMRSVNVCGATLTCLSRCASVCVPMCMCVCFCVCCRGVQFKLPFSCLSRAQTTNLCQVFYINDKYASAPSFQCATHTTTLVSVFMCVFIYICFLCHLNCFVDVLVTLIAYPKRVTTGTPTTTTTPQKIVCIIT